MSTAIIHRAVGLVAGKHVPNRKPCISRWAMAVIELKVSSGPRGYFATVYFFGAASLPSPTQQNRRVVRIEIHTYQMCRSLSDEYAGNECNAGTFQLTNR